MKQRFKNMLERNRWIKGIPNSLTLCNSLCGFASILITLQAYKYSNDPEDGSPSIHRPPLRSAYIRRLPFSMRHDAPHSSK